MLLVDFKEDFKKQIEFELKSFGSDYDENMSHQQNYYIFLKTKRRIPPPQKREVYYAKNFVVPKEHEDNFSVLANKILQGDDLRPYLSRQVSGKYKDKIGKLDFDQALDDLGVHHFHLKAKGTKEIAFAYVTDKAVYFLDILGHSSDVWFNTHLVQIIHDNWSELIAHRKFTLDNKFIPTTEQRIVARKKGYSVPITVSDGTQYFSDAANKEFVEHGGAATTHDFVMFRLMIKHLEYYDSFVRREEMNIRTSLGIIKNEPLILEMIFHDVYFSIFEPIRKTRIITQKIGSPMPKLWLGNL